MPSALLHHLRDQTRTLHQQVERANTLLDPNLTRQGYRETLVRWYGIWRPLEERLSANALWVTRGWQFLPRHPLLRADLVLLGQDANALASLPLCCDLPTLTTSAQALGCRYVLEGSLLGGRVIAQQIQRTLGLTAATGTAFLGGAGPATGQHWYHVCLQLDAYVAEHPTESDAIVTAAQATFAAFARWFTPASSIATAALASGVTHD